MDASRENFACKFRWACDELARPASSSAQEQGGVGQVPTETSFDAELLSGSESVIKQHNYAPGSSRHVHTNGEMKEDIEDLQKLD